jgi:thiamine biosynthesis lipoprotein
VNRAEKTFWISGAAMLAAAVPATAEVYLTEAQALGVVFGEKAFVRREEKMLDAALRKRLEQSSNLRFPEAAFTFFIATQDGKPVKYAVAINEIGKSEPVTFMVGMTPEGKVSEVAIMEFRENRGWEVKEKRFLNQFRGKTVRSATRVDEDIINCAGATLSSKAVARGVKRALLLLDAFYPGESRFKLGAARDFAMPSELKPIATVDCAHETLGLYRQVRYAMGTHCEIRLWSRRGDDASILLREGFGELERIEQIFSAYRPGSELTLVNANAGNASKQVSSDFFEVTRRATQLCRSSSGLVDFTIGPLQELWRSREAEQRRPTPSEIENAKRLVGLDKLALNEPAKSIRFRRSGMKLDFDGIAKGYAAEKIGLRLQKLGAVSSLVNLGRSSLYATRCAPKFAGIADSGSERVRMDEWFVAIAHPANTSKAASHVCLQSASAMSTSGTSERGMLINGERFSHIIDPKTGVPIEGIRSASVIANAGIASEVVSKTLLFAENLLRNDRKLKRGVREWIYLESAADGNVVEKRSQIG